MRLTMLHVRKIRLCVRCNILQNFGSIRFFVLTKSQKVHHRADRIKIAARYVKINFWIIHMTNNKIVQFLKIIILKIY